MTKLSFFCKSPVKDARPYQIVFDTETDDLSCSCQHFTKAKFCSHIDATLIAGERAMIEEEDQPIADEIMTILQQKKKAISVPDDWKASWRADLEWRGFFEDKRATWYRDGKKIPAVCFTGKDPKNPQKSRASYLKEAEAKGFHVSKLFCKSLNIVVAPSPLTNTNKVKGAAAWNIPVLSYDEWALLTADGEIVEDASEIKMDSAPAAPDKVKVVDLNLSRFDSPVLSDEEKEENERWINHLRLIGRVQILAEKIWKKNPDADVEGMIERILDDNLSEDENNEAAAKVLQKELDLLG